MDFLTLIFVFGVIGITHIIVDGEIFQPVRDLWDKIMPPYIAKLIHCYMCAGFWVGIFAYWLLFESQLVWTLFDDPWKYLAGLAWGAMFVAGGASSCLSTLMAYIFNYLETKSVVVELPEK